MKTMIIDVIANSLNEVLSLISFIVGICIIIFAAVCDERQRDNFLKISGVALVVSLAFFSNTIMIYAFSIFIIASLITKLDFLENIAAIFHGDAKAVYDYKIKLLNKSETREKITNEIKEEKEIENLGTLGDRISELTSIPQPTVEIKSINDYESIEKLTLDYISRGLGEIDRYVRIKYGKNIVEFDALKKGKHQYDTIIEVKYTSNLQFIITLMPKLNLQLQKYTLMTGREAILHLYIVSDKLHSQKAELLDSLENVCKKYDIKVFILSEIEIKVDK